MIALADLSGAVVERLSYDSFGNLTSPPGDSGNHYAFTGREWDAETGLYHFRARNSGDASQLPVAPGPTA